MGTPTQDPTKQKQKAPANPGAMNDEDVKQDSKRRPAGDSSSQQGKDAARAPTTDDEIDDGQADADDADAGEADESTTGGARSS